MWHRTKINVSVDSHNELVIRGKLGIGNHEIADNLSHAMDRFDAHWATFDENRDIALMFLDCLEGVVGGVGKYDDFADDQGMDVHVDLDFNSISGHASITYRPDNGYPFSGSFEEFEDEFNLY